MNARLALRWARPAKPASVSAGSGTSCAGSRSGPWSRAPACSWRFSPWARSWGRPTISAGRAGRSPDLSAGERWCPDDGGRTQWSVARVLLHPAARWSIHRPGCPGLRRAEEHRGSACGGLSGVRGPRPPTRSWSTGNVLRASTVSALLIAGPLATVMGPLFRPWTAARPRTLSCSGWLWPRGRGHGPGPGPVGLPLHGAAPRRDDLPGALPRPPAPGAGPMTAGVTVDLLDPTPPHEQLRRQFATLIGDRAIAPGGPPPLDPPTCPRPRPGHRHGRSGLSGTGVRRPHPQPSWWRHPCRGPRSTPTPCSGNA